MRLENGVVLIDGVFRRAQVTVENGTITGVGEDSACGDGIDMRGGYLIPGLIDSHTHGYGGVDTMGGANAVLKMSEAYARHGVTSFLPTTMSARASEIAGAVVSIAACAGSGKGAQILGIHMESCFFSLQHRGAHREQDLLPPSLEAFMAMCGGRDDFIKLVTIAPELEGADELITHAKHRGIVVSAGHSGANIDEMKHAVDIGVSRVTHLFNGMNALHHRNPGVPGAALSFGEIFPELIADGIHVHPAVMTLAARAAGDRLCLVTDSMMAAGMPDGNYKLGNQAISVINGTARTEAGNLAGSTLTLDAAVRNMVRLAGVSAQSAVLMATRNPARSLGLTDRGEILPGMRADLCLMDAELTPRATWVGGELKHCAMAL